ncbi:MAG: hypothetical protein ABEJ28_03705 [Salinigranum sp.]
MRERVGAFDRYRLYLLLEVNRLALAGALAAGLFVTVVTLGVWADTPLRVAMRAGDPTETLFQAFVTSIITGVTLVVAINQLVISQELGALGEQRRRMSETMSFQQDVETHLGGTSPPEPSSFLRALIDATETEARELRSTVSDSPNDEFRSEAEAFLDDLGRHARAVGADLERARFGRYQVVESALDFEYSRTIYRARRLRDEYADDLEDDEREAFDELVELLAYFAPAREHFKTLFFRWELAGLSRGILYLSVPALAVAVAMLAFLEANSFPGATLGADNLLWAVSAAVTFCSFPFLLLASYVLRLATLARRTLAIGPFVLRGGDSGGSGDGGP